jgi:DNA-binding MarR family transcriptional regulator
MDDTNIADWELISRFAQAYRSIADTFADRVDMHRGQSVLLCTLAQEDGITQSTIAERLVVQGATVTTMLQRMEDAGLVTRQRDPEDNRLVRVYLTPLGREKQRAIAEQFYQLQEVLFEGIAEHDRETLRRLLRQMLLNMDVKCSEHSSKQAMNK